MLALLTLLALNSVPLERAAVELAYPADGSVHIGYLSQGTRFEWTTRCRGNRLVVLLERGGQLSLDGVVVNIESGVVRAPKSTLEPTELEPSELEVACRTDILQLRHGNALELKYTLSIPLRFEQSRAKTLPFGPSQLNPSN